MRLMHEAIWALGIAKRGATLQEPGMAPSYVGHRSLTARAPRAAKRPPDQPSNISMRQKKSPQSGQETIRTITNATTMGVMVIRGQTNQLEDEAYKGGP